MGKAVQMETRKGGRLIEPDFHDGYVIGVSILPDRSITVRMQDYLGAAFDMTLSDVGLLNVDCFQMENIIASIVIIPPGEVTSRDWRLITGYREGHPGDEADLNRLLERHATEQWTVVFIDPSVGCHLRASCKRVDLVEA